MPPPTQPPTPPPHRRSFFSAKPTFFPRSGFFFGEADFFFLLHPTKPASPKAHIHYSLYSLYSIYSHFSTCRGAIFCARPSMPTPTQPPTPTSTGEFFFFGEADFFSAKRLFFRAARDVSGVRSSPPWARVVIKLKMSFQALSHSSSHARAPALTSPPPDFFISFIPQNPPKIQINPSPNPLYI